MSPLVPFRRPDALTRREHEVLDLLRLGLTNEEIAGRLGISLDGAKYHVSQILSKFGVSTREEASRIAEPVGRRWSWLGLPLAAKLAGGVVFVAAAAGVGVLALGIASDDQTDDSGSHISTPAPYAHQGTSPRIGEDHWHAPITIYIGDEKQPPIAAFDGGIASEGDGVIHVHPLTPDEEGAGATLARFFDDAGGELTDTSLRMPGSDDTLENGDPVPGDGRKGWLVVFVNSDLCDSTDPRDPSFIVPANYVPHDGDRIMIRFMASDDINKPCLP